LCTDFSTKIDHGFFSRLQLRVRFPSLNSILYKPGIPRLAVAYIPTWGLITDLDRLQYFDVSLTTEGLVFIFLLPEEGHGKVSRIVNLNTEQWDICPVETTKL
jgi:hypothetical protein